MKIAFKTSCLEGYGLNRIFQFAKELEFDGIELVLSRKNFDTLNADYVTELSNQYALPVLAIQAFPNNGPKQIADLVELAKKVGTKIIIIQPPKFFNFKFTQWLKDEVPKIREREQISIAMENAPGETILGFIPAHAISSMSDLKRFKHVCFNTAFSANKKENIIDTFLNIKKYLVHIHLSNIKKERMGGLPHDGSLPIESFLSKLKQEDYKGCVSLDIDPRYLSIGNDKEMKETMKKAKDFCLKYM